MRARTVSTVCLVVPVLVAATADAQQSANPLSAPLTSQAQLQPQPLPPQPPIGTQERRLSPKDMSAPGGKEGTQRELPAQPPMAKEMDAAGRNFNFDKLLRDFGIK